MARSPSAASRSPTTARKIAYALADAGSDWVTWKVRDVETGDDTADEILWSKFSGAEWTPDGSGFFYGRFPEPKEGDDLKAANYFQKMYFHQLGTPQSDDLLVWKDDEHKDWRADPTVTDDGEYLILTLGKGTDDKYRILYRPLDEPDAEPVHLVGNFDHEYTFIDNDGPDLLVQDRQGRSSRQARRHRHPPTSRGELESRSSPRPTRPFKAVHRVGDRLIANYLKDAHSQVKVFDLSGQFEREIPLPGLGTATGFNGDRDDTETFYAFTAYTRPTTIYRYDLASGESSVFKQPRGRLRPGRLRDHAGLLHQQGRHAASPCS